MSSPLYRIIGTLSIPVVKGLYRLRVRGLENVPEGGFVLAANHTSNFDPWPLGIPFLPDRQLRFMAKAELFNPVLAPFLREAKGKQKASEKRFWERVAKTPGDR